MPPVSSLPGVDQQLLETLERAFASHAGADGILDAEELRRALGLKGNYLSQRILGLLDLDGDGVVLKRDFLHGIRKLLWGTVHEKLGFAFRLHDHNGDGLLERDELRRMICLGLVEDDLSVDERYIEHLVEVLLGKMDHDRDGKITYEEFFRAISERPQLLDQLTRSEARWIVPSEELLERFGRRPLSRTVRWARALDNRWLPWTYWSLWALANLAALIVGGLSVVGHGSPRSEPFWIVSKACTNVVAVNTVLILLPVLRRILTSLRSSALGRWVPLDEAQDFHRVAGDTMFYAAVGHSVAALGDYVAQGPWLARLLSTRGGTGALWLLVFTVLWSYARQSVRKSGRFELFYFTHLLYFVWFALGMLHAHQLRVLSVVPLLALGLEFFLRAMHRGTKLPVLSAQALRSGVTRLELRKPVGFVYNPGDWVWLRIPHLARFEWHPFTLSSAPERETLTVHVRTLGNWTSSLRRFVEAQCLAERPQAWELFLDGPYGSPSGDIFAAKHPVLIGAGIGVTPFASVLESLVAKRSAGLSLQLEKGYFYWLNGDQFSFEWFTELLAQVEREDRNHQLELRIWMTSGHAGAGMMGLELGRALSRELGHADPTTGLRSPLRMGHPDWQHELQALKDRHGDGLQVFFCGPPGLGRKVKKHCRALGIAYREEQF